MRRRALFWWGGLAAWTVMVGCAPLVGAVAGRQDSMTASNSDAQPLPVAAASEVPAVPKPGGWMNQPVDSSMIATAAAEAVTLLQARTGDPGLALVAIRTAATQVVAGLNFKLNLDVATKDGPRNVTVVMYRNLQKEYRLTSVEGL